MGGDGGVDGGVDDDGRSDGAAGQAPVMFEVRRTCTKNHFERSLKYEHVLCAPARRPIFKFVDCSTSPPVGLLL